MTETLPAGFQRVPARVRSADRSPRDLFLHAKPWQFGRQGRKYRIVAERMRRLSRVLSRFDRSGNCKSIFALVKTILERVRSAELHYPEQGPPYLRRMKWSRRTVFEYLRRLEAQKICSKAGLLAYHGTRRRLLHAERLLSVPVESCTSTRRESRTRIESLDSKKVHLGGKKHNHHADDAACVPKEPYRRSAESVPYQTRLARFTAMARLNILARTTESPESVDWILRTVIGRALQARTTIRSAAYLERGFESQVADDEAQLERGGAELVATASEMRRKIAFVQACVEQATREGRRARDVLAERLPP
jgi:hypothetical protein